MPGSPTLTLFGAALQAGQSVRHALGRDRQAYLVPSSGKLTVNGQPLDARDGAVIWQEDKLEIAATANSELLLTDLP